MTDQIDWTFGFEKAKDGTLVVPPEAEELCDHWRNLAYQEHEENEKLRWMLERNLALGSAYPKVMLEKLEQEWSARYEKNSSPPPRPWPFR